MASITVSILNQQKKIKIPVGTRPLIRKCCAAVLKAEGVKFPTEISVSFVDNEQIRELNSEYRSKDSATDVLSFPMWEEDELMGEEPVGPRSLGDIVISVERAIEQAEQFGHSLEREIGFLTIHSMLHLLGYDHELGPEEEKEMFARQAEILDMIGLKR